MNFLFLNLYNFLSSIVIIKFLILSQLSYFLLYNYTKNKIHLIILFSVNLAAVLTLLICAEIKYLTYLHSIFFYTQNYFVFKKFDIFSIVLITITVVVSLICNFISIKKNYLYNLKITSTYIVFNMFIFIMCYTNSLLYFFIAYELFLLLSVFLVFISSSNKRSIFTSIYFLLWTQLGSFFVFTGIFYIYFKLNIKYFYQFNLITNQSNFFILISLLLFFGFGIKIPVWPFHFWLTKTHVEANTGFSIFLSGILVKIAIYGLYKFNFFFNNQYNYIFLFFVLFSVIDVSLKLPFQTDYKKLVAYATVFEMNYILINFFFNSNESLNLILYFLVFHSCVSGLFFFLVDILYKNYNTRIINSINSIQTNSTIFSVFFINIINVFFRISTYNKVLSRANNIF